MSNEISTKEITTYASSGVITNNFRTGYAVQISWKVNSQNIANNTSNITVQAQLVSTGSSYTIRATNTKYGSLVINGTTYSFTFNATLNGNQTKTVCTKTVDIPHNSDGSKTISLSATLGIRVWLTSVFWDNVSTSKSGIALNTIPRTSTISLSATSVNVGSAITVNITRASTAFTHKVYYTFGSKSVTISTSATTSASYTIPTDHATVIPNSTSGTATILVETYNGSTKIGSTSKNFTVTLPASIKPSFTSLTAAVVASGAATTLGYVQGKSKAKLTVNGATGAQGSAIVAYSISGGGFSTATSSFTTGVLNNSGSITFTATVTDSRGRKSDAKTVTINVNSYSAPKIEYPTIYRCNSSGTPLDNGTYIKVNFEYTVSTVTSSKATHKIEYKTASATTWTNAGTITSSSGLVFGAGAISATTSYEVRITLSDTVTTVTYLKTIPTAFVTMDIKKGGKAIAFGKAAETDNLVDIAMNLKVSGNGNTQISSTGKSVSWLAGCKGDGALINITSQSGYSPILRQKTTSGAWAMGVYTNDTFHLTYMTDTNINAGNNTVTTQYSFPINGGGTVYTTGNKPKPADIGAAPTTHTHTEYAAASHGTHVSDSGWKNLTLASGISLASGGVARYKKVNNLVYVQINATGISHTGGATAVAKTITTLPSGYRPSAYIPFDATAGASQPNPCRMECNTDGTIKFRSCLNTITTSYAIHIYLCFVI